MPRVNKAFPVEEFKPRVHLDFSKKDTPRGFKDLSIDDGVVLVLHGKVKSLNQHEDSNSFSVEYDKLEVVDGSKAKTMDDAVKQLRG
jgi:hypothetical protein